MLEVYALFVKICYGEIMKKLFLYIFLGFLMTSNAYAFGDIAYVCEWEGTPNNWKTLYQIKDRKIYEDGEDLGEKIEKLSVFFNKVERVTSFVSNVKINDHISGKITTVHKINLSNNKGFEIVTYEHGTKMWGGLTKTKTYIGECHKM